MNLTNKLLAGFTAMSTVVMSIAPIATVAGDYTEDSVYPYGATVWAINNDVTANPTVAAAAPFANITREQFAAIAVRGFDAIGVDLEADDTLNCEYADLDSAAAGLQDYVVEACQKGLFQDADDAVSAKFNPKATVSEAVVSVIFCKALFGADECTADAGEAFYTRANEVNIDQGVMAFEKSNLKMATRGMVFQMFKNVADMIDDGSVDPIIPGTGTTTTGTTTVVVATGYAEVSLASSAGTVDVPKNASSVRVGTVKLTAGANGARIQSLAVTRSGLGNANDILSTNGIRAAINGSVVSSSADFYNATSQVGNVYFSPALTLSAGQSVDVDVIVNLSGAENSSHSFAVTSVNLANGTASGAPVSLGTLRTTSYVVSTVNVSLSNGSSTVTPGQSNQFIAKLDVQAGDRAAMVKSFTLTRNGGVDLTKRLTNVKVFANGVSVGTVDLSAEKIVVNGLTNALEAGNSQIYEVKADILVDNSTSLGLKIDSSSDITAIETSTNYSTQINALGTVNLSFGALQFTFVKQSNGNVTIAPATNNVKFFDGKITSAVPVSVRSLVITTANLGTAATGINAFTNNQLFVKLNGATIATLNAANNGSVTTGIVSFVIDSSTPAVITIEGSVKNLTSIAPSSYQFTVELADVRDTSNNTVSSLGAGKSLVGDRTTIETATVEYRNATIAAPSTTRIYSSAEQEIGRFAVVSRNEASRLTSLTLLNAGTASLTGIANSNSSVKLVDVATNAQISANALITGNQIEFTNMNETIAKDATKNYKVVLGVSSVDDVTSQTIQLQVAASTVVRDINSTAITPTGTPTFKVYTLGIVAPTVKVTSVSEGLFRVRITNIDTNTGITLSGVTFDFKTSLPSNTTYNAVACLRSTSSTSSCGGQDTSAATGSVPALNQMFVLSGSELGGISLEADKNNGFVEFDVLINSANLLPSAGQLQTSVVKVNYVVNGTNANETYVGKVDATATFTK